MNRSVSTLIFLATLGCITTATAAEQPAPPWYTSIEDAIEANSAALVLPSGPASALVVTPCGGCAPVTVRATATTTYYLRKKLVTLADFKAALLGKSVAVTVFRSTKGGALSRVIADLDAPPVQPAKTHR
jgi:hypothetical protein